MNAVFKSVLFVGITACGLYGCSQIFTAPKPVENDTTWEHVAAGNQPSAAHHASLASHEEPDHPLRQSGQAKQALFEFPDESSHPKVRNLPSVDAPLLATRPAHDSTSSKPLPVVRDLPVVNDGPAAQAARISRLPKVVDESETRSESLPNTSNATSNGLASAGRESISNPFTTSSLPSTDMAANGFSTSHLPSVDDEMESPPAPTEAVTISNHHLPTSGFQAARSSQVASGDETVPELTGDVSQHVKNRFFDPDQLSPSAVVATQPSETKKVPNEFAKPAEARMTHNTPAVPADSEEPIPSSPFKASEMPTASNSVPDPVNEPVAAAPAGLTAGAGMGKTPQSMEAQAPPIPPQLADESPATSPTALQSVVAPAIANSAPNAEQPTLAIAQPAVTNTNDPPAVQNSLPSMSASLVVEERALQHIIYGKSLARRGSVFAARQEFMQALRMITESYDMQSGSRAYTDKLAVGLRALAESDDFVAIDTEQQMNMDLRGILETHSTRVIDPSRAAEISPIQAMQAYYAYSVEQLQQAIGQSVVASDALHALGKLLTTTARFDASGKPQDRTKSIVMHQVALAANPANHLSANELGVLLASNGRWEQALDLFSQSLRVQATAATWKNLATAHEQLALRLDDPQKQRQQQELAQLAIREFRTLSGSESLADTAVPQDWATPQQFGDQAAMPEVHDQPQVASAPEEPTETKPAGRGLLKNMKDWF